MQPWFLFGRIVVLITLVTLLAGCSGRSANASTPLTQTIHYDPEQGSCDDADPRTSGCWIADGLILASTTWNNRLADETPMETDLIWSNACQSW